MKTKSEFYKGIEFIQISSLPVDQKEIILASLGPDKVIKILKEDILLPDCILYSDYLTWFNAHHQVSPIAHHKQAPSVSVDVSLVKN